jgi:hypothetical protein
MDNGNENLVPENGVECADGVIGQLQIVPKRHQRSLADLNKKNKLIWFYQPNLRIIKMLPPKKSKLN